MHHRSFHLAAGLFVVAVSAAFTGNALAATPAPAGTSTPALFAMQSGKPTMLADGAQKSWPIAVSEDSAMTAVFSGGMWLPNPAGGREYAKYVKHIVHANGTWTWIGSVQTIHGPQSVVLTFGEGSVYGIVPQAKGYPLRIDTNRGNTVLVETSAADMARSPTMLRLRARPDYVVPPVARGGRGNGLSTAPARLDTIAYPAANAPARADASASGTTIDVMVAYTSGLVTETGSVNNALTRIQYLVDYTNQAYVNSGVNLQIRLVHTVQVDYPDDTSNNTALDDITGTDGNGNSVPIPASLKSIASLRSQYGADLVALLRSYDNSTQGGCGVGWMIGGNETPISPTSDAMFGYSVVSDGSSGGYYCLDSTFAHELGHNMGDAHDRANASESGAYPYSYGYVGNGDDGFATIMAYGSSEQTPLQVFSNPNISTCQNTPCGVADSSSSSADNAHSMNNTAPLIAQFEPTKTQTVSPLLDYVHNDINGDGMSDLLWRTKDDKTFSYWLMHGTTLAGSAQMPVSAQYKLVASGDFNGDGKVDIIWTDGTGMWMWVGNGSSFTSTYMRPYPPGWKVVGTPDLDGDGKSDLVWVDGNRISEWLMNGTAFTSTYIQTLSSSWRYLTTGDFDGDGKADLLLSNGSSMKMWTQFSNGSFKSVATHTYPPRWTILGAGDINGDGKADLLWRDDARRRFSFWLMQGGTLASSRIINVSPQWQFATTGDFTGNGLLGIVWYNSRVVNVWPGNADGDFRGVIVHSYPTRWNLLP